MSEAPSRTASSFPWRNFLAHQDVHLKASCEWAWAWTVVSQPNLTCILDQGLPRCDSACPGPRTRNLCSRHLRYPPSTTVHAPTPTPKWDPLHRPQPRPITLSHDESRLYNYGADDDIAGGRHAGKGSVKKLGFFKQADEEREKGDDGSDKQYVRDEL